MRKCGIEPTAITRSDGTPKRSAAALIDEVDDCVAVYGGGNGLAKLRVVKPLLLAEETWGDFRVSTEVVEIEEEKVVFETGAGVRHREVALLTTENGEIFRAETRDEVGFAALEFQDLSVSARHEEEYQFVEIRKAGTGGVCFPVVGVALESELLAGDVFFEAKGAEARKLVWSSGRRPELSEFSFLVRLLE